MSVATPNALRVVLHEGVGTRTLSPERRLEVLEALLDAGFAVTYPSPGRAVAPPDASDVLVLYESADGGGKVEDGAAGGVQVHVRDVRGAGREQVAEIAESVRAEAGAHRSGAWKPWFPVIDYGRCTNCMQCLSFCLFGVYGADAAGRIQVQNEDKCKTNCPACSRVCPEVAILFPKYGQGPINGDEVRKEDVEREKMKIDISALLGGDIYALLRQRHERAASRFSKERDESKALKERERCLRALKDGSGDLAEIPPEVLMALPSAAEIERRAAEATARARAALEANTASRELRTPRQQTGET
jgi:NAD-dependent dihydropyrimidine dehydrogenase PreA subunit